MTDTQDVALVLETAGDSGRNKYDEDDEIVTDRAYTLLPISRVQRVRVCRWRVLLDWSVLAAGERARWTLQIRSGGLP